MNNMQAIQKAIDDFRSITSRTIAIYDRDGRLFAKSNFNKEIDRKIIITFSESVADNQEVDGYCYFKIFDEDELLYILLISSGNDVHTQGKLLVSQIHNIIKIYHDRDSKSSFIQNLMLDNLLQIDIYNRAKKMKMDMDKKRIVYLIEQKDKSAEIIKILNHIFVDEACAAAIDEEYIALVKDFTDKDNNESRLKTAHTILDMINSEMMIKARIGYGGVVNSLKEVSLSYKEAKLALDVGKIFYPAMGIISYDSLGIGRLIYQLPVNLCELFMKETFREEPIQNLDEEEIHTINKFFENNLNISETARQLYVHRNTLVYRLERLEKLTGLDIRRFPDALTFKIAMMVSDYMEYMKQNKSN